MPRDDLDLLATTGARDPRPVPGDAYRARMDLGGLGPVPVLVRVCREPVGEDEVAVAVGLSVTVTCAAVILVAAAGRAEGLPGVLAQVATAPAAPPILVVDA